MSGFTMVELMITITIIFLLFSMLAIAAGPMRRKARTKKTDGVIYRISLSVAQYHATTGYFPPDGLDGETVETAEGTIRKSGAALTWALTQPVRAMKKQPDGSYKAMGEQEPMGDFKEFTTPYLDDPEAIELIDGFGEPFHYDRLTGGRSSYSVQDDGDVHVNWDAMASPVHHDDPREATGEAVENPGPQNVDEYDLWSHGMNSHTDDELPQDVLANWSVPTVRVDGDK